MSWVPRVVAPVFRAFRQLALRRGAQRAATQTLKAMGRFPKAKAKVVPKKSLPQVGPMPFYRRRRFPIRRRRFLRRRYGARKTVNKIHTFVRWCDKDSVYGDNGPNQIVETGADQHLSYQFKLDQVSAATDFTALYDMYKINKVQLFLEPVYDQTGVVGTANPSNKKIVVVHDYNDASPLANEDDYLQYGNCKRYAIWSRNGIRITLYPKINNVIENVTGAATGFTSLSSNKQFLNIATDEVPHFGIKIMIPASVVTNQFPIFRVRAKFWLSMRGTK